jgi:hypothetical protein
MTQTDNSVVCGGCARGYKWKPEFAGKKAKCKCGQTVRFPADEPSAVMQPELDLLSDPHIGGSGKPAKKAAKAPAAKPAKAPEFEGVGGGEYDLNEPAKAAPVARAAVAGGCAGCGAALADGAVVCIKCGMNQKTGKKLGTAVDRSGSNGRTVGMSASAPAAKPSGMSAVMNSVWIWPVILFVGLGLVGLVGIFMLPPKTGVNVCLGVAIAGLIINVIGTMWGIRTACGDNIGLRLACRFVPFLGWVLILMKSFSEWDEMKVPVLTLLTGIGVGGMGLVMWLVACAHAGMEAAL